MASFSLTQWLVVLAVSHDYVRSRSPSQHHGRLRGIRAFRSGMRDDAATQTAGERPAEAQPVTGSPR